MRVLVTGANGHLGYNLVKKLLQTDYVVRGSIRSLEDQDKVKRLESLGNIEVVEAELDKPDQLRKAMEGVDVLYHAAAIYKYFAPGMESEIVNASVNGIDNTFRAAADANIKKIILTSSIVTLPLTNLGDEPSDEESWQTDLRTPYIRAKTEGEKKGWELAKEKNLNLVTVLPGGIIGPDFARNTPSIDIIEAMMFGAFRVGVPNLNYPIVDVRDVVDAHILAGENDCNGRFLVCNDKFPTFNEILTILHRIDSKISLPLMTLPQFMNGLLVSFDKFNKLTLKTPRTISEELFLTLKGKTWNVNNKRIKDLLGWRQNISLSQSLSDTMEKIKKLKSKS